MCPLGYAIFNLHFALNIQKKQTWFTEYLHVKGLLDIFANAGTANILRITALRAERFHVKTQKRLDKPHYIVKLVLNNMKKEYDFSKGERGKFYRPNAELNFPVYLDPEITKFIRNLTGEKDTDIETIVNDWLRKDIELIQTVR